MVYNLNKVPPPSKTHLFANSAFDWLLFSYWHDITINYIKCIPVSD